MFKNITLTGFADEIAASLDTQMQVLDKLQMKHIEMRGVDGRNFVEYSEGEARQIKKRLEDRGFSLSAVGSPIGKIRITDDFAPHMELFRHTVELAHIMNTPNIRMFSFYGPEGESDSSSWRAEVMERLGQFVDYAAANGIVLLHENEKGIYGEMAQGCLDILKQFSGEHFKAVFDFANFVQAGQDTLEAFEMLKPYIAYIHVKDALGKDGSVVPAGYGDGNVKEILGRLKADGYSGYLSLEPHLSDFTGFSALEKDGRIGKKLSGEEAFTLAHDALVKILEQL
ncbi:MAG: sugar phosphate isomerase/epimerase [bacterium]|nr:sugar phosphate isomerase/epimerase [bacterium]MCM1373546.1 sugar phosphate isomerase/epimerase [Muribaculum sp.]